MAEVPLYFMIGAIFPGTTSGQWTLLNGNFGLLWSATILNYPALNGGAQHPARIWNYVGVANPLSSIATGSPTTITWTVAHGHPIGTQFQVNITNVTGAAPSELLNRSHTATVTGTYTATISLVTTGAATGGEVKYPALDFYQGADTTSVSNSHTQLNAGGAYPSLYFGPDLQLMRHIDEEESTPRYAIVKHSTKVGSVAMRTHERAITSITKSGTDLVFALDSDHDQSGSFEIVIFGVTGNDPDLPNGKWQAIYVSDNEFSIALDSATVGTGGRVAIFPRWSKRYKGNGEQWDELASVITQVCDHVRDAGDTPVIRGAWICMGYVEASVAVPLSAPNTVAIQGVSVQTDWITVTLALPHGRETGERAHVTMTGIAGLTPAVNGETWGEVTGLQTLRVYLKVTGTPTLDAGAQVIIRDPIYDLGDDYAEFIADVRDHFVSETGGAPTDYPVVVMRPEPDDEAYGALSGYAIRQEVPKAVQAEKVALLAIPDFQTAGVTYLFPSAEETIRLGRKLWESFNNARGGLAVAGNGAAVYLALGQSQLGAGSTASAFWNGDPDFIGPQVDEKIWNHTSKQFEDYDTQANNSTHPTRNTGGFGPACSLLKELKKRHPSQPVYLLQLYQDSSSLGSGTTSLPVWNKTAGDLWPELESAWDDAKQWLFNHGLTANVNGVFFMQGESDTGETALYENYADNLRTFIGDVRDLVTTRPENESEVPFVICKLIDHPDQQFLAAGVAGVRAAQIAVATGDSQVSIVDLDSLPISSDKVHITAEACFDAGALIAPGLDQVSDDYDPGSVSGSGGLDVV